MSTYNTACFIGYRPSAFKDLHISTCPLPDDLGAWLDKTIEYLISERNVRRFVCGNDIGIDIWEAKAVLKHKRLHPDIILEIAIPYERCNATIPEVAEMQKNADIVNIISQKQNRLAAYTERDQYMERQSDFIIGIVQLIDGEIRTRNTRQMLLQAKAHGKEIYIYKVKK